MKYLFAVKKLRKIANGKYCSINYERTYFHTSESKQECTLYIDGEGSYSEKTWKKAFKLLEIKNDIAVVKDSEAPGDELLLKED